MPKITFKERYDIAKTWQERVTVMGLYHLAMTQVSTGSKWTISQTAQFFECSSGLVSENIRLADAFHKYPALARCETRQDAIERLNRMPKHA